MRIVLAIGLVILTAAFVFADDRIWLENAKIDGKDVRMVFDSGANFIGVTSQAVKRLGLRVITPPTNGFGETAVYSGEFDGAPFRTNFDIIQINNTIPDFDAVMGWGPLSSSIFRIDAQSQQLTPFPGVPAGVKSWTQLSIDTNAGTLDLEIPGKRGHHDIITIDTGASFGIELTTREWKQWRKAHPHNPVTLRGYWTIDGIYAGEESWADQIQIGPLVLYDVPVMEEGPSTKIEFGSERDVLDFAALRRLDLLVDGIHGVAWLRAKQTPPPPYSYNRLGAEFMPTSRDSNGLVARVLTGTPAYEAGVRNGDILFKVDGRSISGWTNGWNESGNSSFLMPAGTKVRLTLQRNKKTFETTATLREILQPSHRKYKLVDDFPGKSEMDAETYVNQGYECENRGDSNGALMNYDKAIESDPNCGYAYSRRGYLEQSNNPDAALADYSKAINLGSGTAEGYGDRGMVEQGKGDVNAALADYNKAIELEPDWAEPYAYRGSLEQRTHELNPAIVDYEKALQLNTAWPGIKPALAQLYDYRGSWDQRTNELDAAIADYGRALQLEPDLSTTKTNLANVYGYRGDREMRTNQADAALADFNRVIALEPGWAQAYVDRGWLEQQKGDLNAALGDDTKAIGLTPESAGIYASRGYLEQTMGKIHTALADNDKAIQLDPRSAELYGNRSGVEEILGDLDRSEADCAEAARLDPKMATKAAQEFRNLGGRRYERLEYTNALTDYHKACELKPTDDYAHFDIWLCSSSLGNSERANTDLKAYLIARGSKDTGDWPSEVGRFLVGQITEQDLLRAAKSADAKKDREQYCEAYYYIGHKRLIAGDKKAAAAEFRKCLTTDVRNWVEYDFAKAELQMLETNGVSP